MDWDTLGIVGLLLHCFYFAATAVMCVVYIVPALHSRLLQYGARKSYTVGRTRLKLVVDDRPPYMTPILSSFFDRIEALQVPHGWFFHFYVVSTAMLLFWLQQAYNSGTALMFITSLESPRTMPMTSAQLMTVWVLMSLQSIRRLSESLFLSKASNTTMWIGHYVMGLAFYVAVNISLWIEGIPLRLPRAEWYDLRGAFQRTETSWKTYVCLLTFLFASVVQHRAHVYLSDLKKYSLPTRFPFNRVVSPHYTAECVIYLSLAVLAAPPGHISNRSLSSALVFVVMNLGISADTTRSWMLQEFPERSTDIEERWTMIPGLW